MQFQMAQTPIADILGRMWPVGSIFISAVDTDPADLMGFGVWEAFGAGRVPVGIDAGQAEFDTLGETGGAKTHTLTPAEMPAHTHIQDAHNHTQNAHTHTLATGTTATGNFSQVIGTVDTSSGGTGGTPTQTALGTLSGAATAVNQSATATNQSTGGDGAHNNLQPFVVVRMWRRTG